MRLMIVMEQPRMPMEDCAIAGPMIALYGRRPRANRRRRHQFNPDLTGAVGLAVLAWALVGLVLLF